MADDLRAKELETNRKLTDHVRGRIEAEALTGQIILHAHRGLIRKVETRTFVTADDLTPDAPEG